MVKTTENGLARNGAKTWRADKKGDSDVEMETSGGLLPGQRGRRFALPVFFHFL